MFLCALLSNMEIYQSCQRASRVTFPKRNSTSSCQRSARLTVPTSGQRSSSLDGVEPGEKKSGVFLSIAWIATLMEPLDSEYPPGKPNGSGSCHSMKKPPQPFASYWPSEKPNGDYAIGSPAWKRTTFSCIMVGSSQQNTCLRMRSPESVKPLASPPLTTKDRSRPTASDIPSARPWLGKVRGCALFKKSLGMKVWK